MNNNVGKIFEYEDLRFGTSLFINAPDRFISEDSDKVLNKYIDWFNNDFLVNEHDYEPVKKEYFKFKRCFMFIDFYDDLNGDR